MSIFDELRDEVFDWLWDGQDIDSIKKDLLAVVDESEEKVKSTVRNDSLDKITVGLKDYAETMYGDLATENYGSAEYYKAAQDILKNLDAAFEELQNTAKWAEKVWKNADPNHRVNPVTKLTNGATVSGKIDNGIDDQIIKEFLGALAGKPAK